MPDYSTDALVADIKRRAAMPTSQALYTEANIVEFADEVMKSVLVPMIISVREEFYVTSHDFNSVANQATYAIPSKAIASGLRDVVFTDANGNEYNLPRVSQEERSARAHYPRTSGFFLQADRVGIYPTPTSINDTFRLYYFRRPNTLVPTDDAGKVTVVDTGTKTLTCQSLPSTIQTNTVIDVVRSTPPFDVILEDVTAVRSGFDMTFTVDVSDVSANDYICLSGESVFPQIPVEGIPCLAQGAAVHALEALEDDKAYAMAQRRFTQMQDAFLKILTPRVQGEAKKVISGTNISYYAGRRSW